LTQDARPDSRYVDVATVSNETELDMSLEADILALAERAQGAAALMGEVGTQRKNDWLRRAAERLESAKDAILDANTRDMAEAKTQGIPDPLAGRLGISAVKWRDMIQGLRDVAALPDPVGRVSDHSVRPNGL
jgi:glutamate-5-semialdehyde dehydrogenase